MKHPETTCHQQPLRLAFGVHRAAANAPQRIVGQVESDAQALAISIAAGGHKLDYIAACIGKSRSYVSRMQTGSAPIPDRLVAPLCAATNSNLLAQYRAMQEALGEVPPVHRLASMLAAHVQGMAA